MNKIVNDKLYETRKELVKEITELSEAQFNAKLEPNKWSIAQVCHHLVLTEEVSIKAIAWGVKENGGTQKKRKEIQLILLDRTIKIKAPQIVAPLAEPFEVLQILDLLNESRKRLIAFLNTIEDKSTLADKSMYHPAFGELPLDQWVEHIYLHEQRHIEQIKELKFLLEIRQ